MRKNRDKASETAAASPTASPTATPVESPVEASNGQTSGSAPDQAAAASAVPAPPAGAAANDAVDWGEVLKPVPLSEADEFLEQIRVQNREVRRKQAIYDEAKEEAAIAKKAVDLAEEKLHKLIEQQQDQTPLFDRVSSPDGSGAAHGVGLEEDDSWKDTPLAELLSGLPPSFAKSMEDQELRTLGELTAFLAHKRLIDIPGLGEKKAEKVEEALEAFWKRRAESVPPCPAETLPAAHGEGCDGQAVATAEPLVAEEASA